MAVLLNLPKLNQITITDAFWRRYVEMVSNVIVPYQWKIINNLNPDAEPTYCLENFRIAAGEKEGVHRGVVFIDSDAYKWLETVSYCIQNGTGKQYEELAEEVIELIGRAQQDDGYLNTYYAIEKPDSRWSNLVEGHELYCAGYLIEAAIAYYRATEKKTLLDIAIKFSDLICDVFGGGEGQIKGYPGHQEIELALVKLYQCTQEKRYLECARFFIEERGKKPSYFLSEIENSKRPEFFPEFDNYSLMYSQAHMPAREQTTADGHAVRAVYMYCAMADIAAEYNDEEMLAQCEGLWNSITQKRMYITAGIGSSGTLERFTTDYHLPNDSAYCETCASIGLALFGRRMTMHTKKAAYFDIVERALYNTILAGVSVEGDRYFYVNPLEVWPDSCLDHTALSHVRPVRQRWFKVACCPPNTARTLASLGEYIYAENDDDICINLLIASKYEISGEKENLLIEMASSAIHDGNIEITLSGNTKLKKNVLIRIPEYAENPVFLFDEKSVLPEIINGYAKFSGFSKPNHKITIKFEVRPRWVGANTNVREDIGKAALMKGPCVYCLEEADNGSNLSAVYVDPTAAVLEEKQSELPGGYPFLAYNGQRIEQGFDNSEKLYDDYRFKIKPVKLRAVPYALWGNRQKGEMLVWQKTIISKKNE